MTTEYNRNPGCLELIVTFFNHLIPRSPIVDSTLPYRMRDDFLSPAEFSYYKVLTSVLGPRATVCVKVRMADILFVSRPNENIGFRNRIAQRHIDFLLCDASTMDPVLAIELDDSSHSRSKRKERDEFVSEALEAANLPLLRVVPRRQYSKQEVIDQLKPFLLSPKPATASPLSGDHVAGEVPSSMYDIPPTCPKCGVSMVLRTATQGKHKGQRFYGCPNFPNCRQVLPLSDEKSVG